MNRRYYTSLEVARLLGYQLQTVKKMVDRGELPGWRTAGGHRRISIDTVADELVSRRQASQDRQFWNGKFLAIIDSAAQGRLIKGIFESEFPGSQLVVESDYVAGISMLGRLEPTALIVNVPLPGIDTGTLLAGLRRHPYAKLGRLLTIEGESLVGPVSRKGPGGTERRDRALQDLVEKIRTFVRAQEAPPMPPAEAPMSEPTLRGQRLSASTRDDATTACAVSMDDFVRRIPEALLGRSGKVFYSGREAWSAHTPLYVLGVNPAGNPAQHKTETVHSHTDTVLHRHRPDWSAYRDESWEELPPGTDGMAPRVLHLFEQLCLNPGLVPASSLVFVRSCSEPLLGKEFRALADLCWPFHAYAIEQLGARVVLCLGRTAGKYVCERLGAGKLIGHFAESNERRWRSLTYKAPTGCKVIVATDPNLADWSAPSADPSGLVREALLRP